MAACIDDLHDIINCFIYYLLAVDPQMQPSAIDPSVCQKNSFAIRWYPSVNIEFVCIICTFAYISSFVCSARSKRCTSTDNVMQ